MHKAWLVARYEYLRITRKRSYRLGMLAVPLFFAVLILVVAMYFLPDLLDKMPVAVGAILAAVLAFLGYRVGLGRFYISAIATLLTGLGAAVYVADELLGAALAFVVAGLVLMVGGGLAFLSYLRDHPLREEETAP